MERINGVNPGTSPVLGVKGRTTIKLSPSAQSSSTFCDIGFTNFFVQIVRSCEKVFTNFERKYKPYMMFHQQKSYSKFGERCLDRCSHAENDAAST